MSVAVISALFLKDDGSGFQTGATGLTLTDIEFTVRSINKTTGAVAVVLNAVNPDIESANGFYHKYNVTVDLETYDYTIFAEYTGATVLTETEIFGTLSLDLSGISSIVNLSAGAVEFTYTVKEADDTPINGVDVWFTTDVAGSNVVWRGTTNVFGVARDSANGKPMLDAGTYYVWRQKVGFIFDNPDTEAVA